MKRPQGDFKLGTVFEQVSPEVVVTHHIPLKQQALNNSLLCMPNRSLSSTTTEPELLQLQSVPTLPRYCSDGGKEGMEGGERKGRRGTVKGGREKDH